MTEQPPSFAPQNPPTRPNASGAREVGTGELPSRTVQPARAVRPVRRRSVFRVTSPSPDDAVQEASVRPASAAASASASASAPASRPAQAQAVRADEEAAAPAPSSAQPPSFAPSSAPLSSRATRPQVHVSRERAARPAPARSARPASQQAPAASATRPAYARSSLPTKAASAAHSLPHLPRPNRRWLALLLVLALLWPAYLYIYGSVKLDHVEALSGAPNTPGDTWLLVGSDRREEGVLEDGWEGERTDTIMLMQIPESGRTSLISIPRDTLVDIEGYGPAKINASYAYGGAPLLVSTVEALSGLTVDHYVEVSMGGLENLVEAVGGVNVCYDADVSDTDSGMEWTAGCHDVDGPEALSFARMRHADPLGDIGRTARQRQLMKKIISKAASPSTLVRPLRQRALVGTASENLRTDAGTGIGSLGRAGVAMRSVMGEDGLLGHPPIENLGYWYAGQSCVLLDQDRSEDFFAHMREGTLTPEELNVMPVG